MFAIIPLFLISTRILASNVDLCGDLLDECKLIGVRYICPKLNSKSTFVYKNTYQNCTMDSFKIYFNLNKPSIIDNTFNLDLIEEKCQYLKYNSSNNRYYYMRNIKGFDINYNIYMIISSIDIYFYDSIFEFYSNGTLIRSCDDLKPGIDPKPFFRNIMSIVTVLHLKTVKFKTRICPLIFNSMPETYITLTLII